MPTAVASVTVVSGWWSEGAPRAAEDTPRAAEELRRSAEETEEVFPLMTRTSHCYSSHHGSCCGPGCSPGCVSCQYRCNNLCAGAGCQITAPVASLKDPNGLATRATTDSGARSDRHPSATLCDKATSSPAEGLVPGSIGGAGAGAGVTGLLGEAGGCASVEGMHDSAPSRG